jgi:DNA polymerase-3 subunit epsilon
MTNKMNLDFTIIDFETSGLMPATDQIIETSVIQVRDGVPVMTFNTLVALRKESLGTDAIRLSPKVTELTGHKEEDLMFAMDEEILASILAHMIGEEELIIAHNALFDLSFLNALWMRHGFTELTNPFIDSLTIARDREPYPHKLEDCCRRNGVELVDAHSAEADTFALLDLILKYHKDKDISEWINVAGYRPKYGEPEWYPEGTVLKKQGAEIVKHGLKPVKAPITTAGRVATSNKKKKVPGGEPGDLP